jgi:hypothetical protein
VLLRRRLEAVIDDLTNVRGRVAAGSDADRAGVARRCGEAAARAAGETTEIAGEFRGIHRELVNNGLATPEVESRLLGQIAAPLDAVVAEELAAVIRLCRQPGATADAGAGAGAGAEVVPAVDAAVARLRAVLERMLELESINEVIERLRGVIRVQEQIRDDTLERQRRRSREALESP